MAEQINTPEFHDSAKLHVTGRATYVDDMAVPSSCLRILLGLMRQGVYRMFKKFCTLIPR